MKKRIIWFLFFSRGQHPVIANYLFWRSFINFPNFFRLPRVHAYRRDTNDTYMDKHEYERILAKLKNQLKFKPDFIKDCVTKAEKYFKEEKKLNINLKRINWQSYSNKRCFNYCDKFFQRLIKYFAYVYWPLWVEEAAREIVKQEFVDKFGKSWETVWFTVTRPTRLTYYQQLRFNLLKISSDWQSGKIDYNEVQDRVEKLVKKFDYLKTYIFRVNFYTSKELLREIKKLRGRASVELKQWHSRRLLEQKKQHITQRKLSPETRLITETVAEVVYLRDQRIGWWAHTVVTFYPLLLSCAGKLGLTYDQFLQLTEKEILNQKYNLDTINKRSQGYSFIGIGNKAVIKLQRPKNQKRFLLKQIMGVPANRGKVCGVIQYGDAYTFSKLKRGVILVTAMTTPDSVAYLKGIKGLITDEGGATAHAAIIARELKIPCIVGTKIATKVFKNGDLVEVDANKGVIKLIKKSR